MTPPDERSPHKAGSGNVLGGEVPGNHTTDEPRERPFILQWRSAVLNSSLTSTQKLCLLVLAEWAELDGSDCFPAMESVAQKAGVNEKTVRRALDATEPLGWFRRQHRHSTKGWKHFQYTLSLPVAADTRSARSSVAPDNESGTNPDAPGTESTGYAHAPGTVSGTNPPENACTGLSVPLHRTMCPDAPGTESTEVSNEVGEEVGALISKAPPDDRFSEFYAVYPRHEARVVAEKSWKRQKLDRIADEIIADVTARLADGGPWKGTEKKFLPLPSTYVNQCRWLDEWKPAGGAGGAGVVGSIERDQRSEEEIQQANEAELARFGLGAAA